MRPPTSIDFTFPPEDLDQWNAFPQSIRSAMNGQWVEARRPLSMVFEISRWVDRTSTGASFGKFRATVKSISRPYDWFRDQTLDLAAIELSRA